MCVLLMTAMNNKMKILRQMSMHIFYTLNIKKTMQIMLMVTLYPYVMPHFRG